MIMVTGQKPLEEITQSLEEYEKVYIIGCGTCATMLHTGGKSEVLKMSKDLQEAGKMVTGWMVIPTVCDSLTRDALIKNAEDSSKADCILVMSCAFGVQTVSNYTDKRVYPALNTLFMGKEEPLGVITEICMQCGNCILDKTGAICPVVSCAKSLFNGPCGGSVGGVCEISKDVPCAWQLIIDRLTGLGQLDELEQIQPVRDWSTSNAGGPRKVVLDD